ncbi:MAG TPA: FAD-dependent monooxygenase [Burkholderiales bacterium]|nr:FAD-dependent monooxygenase [Burkholderiales bacterium]
MHRRVVVVGAGPVGLTAALALALQDIPVLVLEAEPALTHDLRAGSYHPPTLDMLAPLGVTEEMLARGLRVRRWQFRDRREGLIVEWDLGLLAGDTAFAFRLHLEQHRLTPILLGKLRALPHVEVLFSHPVRHVSQDEGAVRVTCGTPGGEAPFAGEWLIGADGGHSVVRKALATEFEGFTWPERNVIISTPYDLEQHGFAYNTYIADPQEWAGLFKVPHDGPPGLWRIGFPVPDAETDEHALSEQGVQQRLRRLLPWRESYEVAYRSIYRVHQRVARDWRRGRILIAGDAAHLNNPVGGMGLNGGIHDAVNLAEKLGRVWRGEADQGLLDLYVKQRRTANVEFIQEGSIRNKRNLEERDEATRRRRHDELRAMAADPERARQFLLGTSMIASVRRSESITA